MSSSDIKYPTNYRFNPENFHLLSLLFGISVDKNYLKKNSSIRLILIRVITTSLFDNLQVSIVALARLATYLLNFIYELNAFYS